MQELKIYRCEICGTTYSTKTKCQECERGHRKPRDIKEAKYLPISQDATGYPTYINVKMDNGKVVRYEKTEGSGIMQELEKILKEIDEIKVGFDTECRSKCDLYDWSCGACVGECDEYIKERAKEIIRKHMNDGWIPAKDKPTEDGFYVATMSGSLVDQEEDFVGLSEFEDGEWVDGDDVIAWRPLPEPYRPERSEEE